jgi:hypothetical protein
MTVADGNFEQLRAHTHWPGASSAWPIVRLINVNGNHVGPPNNPQQTSEVLDFSEDPEYTTSVSPGMVNNDVSRIPEARTANTFAWARITSIVRSALVCAVLALALASIMSLAVGLPVIPGWVQGVFAMGGIAVGATIGVVRGPVT